MLSVFLVAQNAPRRTAERPAPARETERPSPTPRVERRAPQFEQGYDRPTRDRGTMPQREYRPNREQRPTDSVPTRRSQGPQGREGRSMQQNESRFRPIVEPRPRPRATLKPGEHTWKQRDILKEIQEMSRRGNIRVTPVDEMTDKVTGAADFPSGWRAYGFRVPPGENIHMRLRHPNQGWFGLMMVNKWGSLEEGMLQNVIPTGNPEVKYNNPTKEARSVYVIVDDPGWMSSEGNPYEITITRSWDPKVKDIKDVKVVEGIWAESKVEGTPEAGS